MRRIIVLLALLVTITVSAQPNLVGNYFDELESERISSGYLQDKAIDYVDLGIYDGSALTPANETSIITFRNFFWTLNSARSDSSVPSYDANAIVSSMMSGSGVVLNIGLFYYDYLLPNAVGDRKIRVIAGQFYDCYDENENWINPYGLGYALLLAAGKMVHEGTNVTYTLGNNGNVYSNCAEQISTVEFDAGDGSGFVPVSGNFTYSVTYPFPGNKELKVKVTLTNGSILLGHSNILITLPTTSSVNANADGSQTFTLNTQYEQEPVSALVSWKCSSSHNGVITNPFIYVEGFDDPALSAFRAFSDGPFAKVRILSSLVNGVDANAFTFDNTITECGSIVNDHDFVYVDWHNPRADIRANAALLESIIDYINQQKHNSSNPGRNIVMGHSMGGLVARYALTEMERNGNPHETDYYISFDSPHLGANVPIGFQYAVRNLYGFLYGNGWQEGILYTSFFKSKVDRIIGALESTSARQMLCYYVNSDSSINDSVHNEWQGILSQTGFPKGDAGHPIENLSVINGKDLNSTGDTLLGVKISELPINSIIKRIISLFNFDLSMHVYRHTASSSVVETDTLSFMKINWTQGIHNVTHTHTRTAPIITTSYDLLSGSYLSDSTVSYPGLYVQGKFTFVPIASALAVDNYTPNFAYELVEPLTQTPFHDFYFSNAGNHANSTDGIIDWCLSHIGTSISGPEGLVLPGETFSLSTDPSFSLSNIIWSSSDSSIASINPITGTVSVNAPGQFVRFTASAIKGSKQIRKHRTILAGYPDMILNVTRPSPGHFQVTASCIDTTLNAYLDTLAAKNVISFEWGMDAPLGGIVWQASSGRQFQYVGNEKTVYCRIRKGAMAPSKTICTLESNPIVGELSPYALVPSMVFVSEDDVWMYYGSGVQDPGGPANSPSYYALAWINEDDGQPLVPDNILIGSQTIQLTDTVQQSVNGEMKTIYCFDLMEHQGVLDAISAIQSGNYTGLGYLFHCSLRSGTTVLLRIPLTITAL